MLVNSNDGIVEAMIEGDKLKVAVRHADGKVVWNTTYSEMNKIF